MLKDAGLVPEDEEEAAEKAAEAERERNRQLRKQQSLITRARIVENERSGGSSDGDSDLDDDERQQLNGTQHSLFGDTG